MGPLKYALRVPYKNAFNQAAKCRSQDAYMCRFLCVQNIEGIRHVAQERCAWHGLCFSIGDAGDDECHC